MKQTNPPKEGKPFPRRPHNTKKPSRIHQVMAEDQPEPIQEDDSSDDEYLYTLGNSTNAKTSIVSVAVSNVPVKMMIDSGSSIDIMDEGSFNEACKKCAINLRPSTKRIFAYYMGNLRLTSLLVKTTPSQQFMLWKEGMVLF